MRNKVLLVFFLLSFADLHALSKWDFFCYDGFDRLEVGARIGAGFSTIGNMKPMLEKTELSPDYSWESKPFIRPTASMFAEYKFFRAAAELEASYYVQGMRLLEHKRLENAEYGIDMQYLSVGLNFRLYCTEQFYFGACSRYGFNIGSRMTFKSDRFILYGDYEGRVCKQLDESFDFGNELAAGLMLGYVFKNGLQVEGRCMYGLTDPIQTLKNDYDYSEQKNNTLWVGLTIGYPIVIFKR